MSGRHAALVVLAGALALALSYPPFPLPVLSFVALVPALLLLREAVAAGSPRVAFRWGFWYGVGAQALVLYWMVVALWHFTPLSALGYLATVLLLGLWTAGLFWFVARIRLRWPTVPLWAAFPVAWTAVEWGIGHQGDIRFPWLGLGTSLADAPVLVQWADLAGARGVTLWLAWCNVMVVEAVTESRGVLGRAGVRRGVAVLATAALALGYGAWRERTLPVREAGKVALLQPNEGFREKWEEARRDSVIGKLLDMSRRVLAGARADLLIWPEAAIPDWLFRRPDWEVRIAALARDHGVPVLAGGLHVATLPDGSPDYRRYYNAAFFYDASGERRRYPVYGKRYLVPVVERVPFVPVRWFRSVPGLERWSGGFSPGREFPLYATAPGRFGVLICYESAFEDLARRYRRAGADFLVNITNDAWFGRTSAPYQHVSHLVLRAIETRTGVARAANSGISAFVDPLGRLYAATAIEREATVMDTLRTSDVRTVYVRVGDWVGALVVLATLAFAGLLLVEQWRARRPSS